MKSGGLYCVVAEGLNIPKQIWSQGEAHEARHWIPCFDHPVDKLTTEMEVLAPEGLAAISNGALVSTTADEENGGTWYHWKQDTPHTTYLIAVVVGEFEEYTETWDGIEIRSLVRPERIDDAPRSFELTGDMMRLGFEAVDAQVFGASMPVPRTMIVLDESPKKKKRAPEAEAEAAA